MSCHPECSWLCDDPICLAECMIVAEPPQCTCENPLIIPVCSVECPPSQCELDQCPVCQTSCTPNTSCGQIQCQQTLTSWACRKPSSCPQPRCELMCEKPACEYVGTADPWVKKNDFSWGILIIGLLALFLWGINTINVTR
jgi:hypothetical protein